MHEHAFGIQGHAIAVIQAALMDVLSKLGKKKQETYFMNEREVLYNNIIMFLFQIVDDLML